jgi:hypothetical protein
MVPSAVPNGDAIALQMEHKGTKKRPSSSVSFLYYGVGVFSATSMESKPTPPSESGIGACMATYQ